MDLFTIDRFRGILTEDERGGSPEYAHYDSVNFWLRAGNTSVRNRKGFSTGDVSAAADFYRQVFGHSSTKTLARRGTTLAAVDNLDTEATTTSVANGFVDFTTVGTPSASYTFTADGTAALISYDGSSFAAGSSAATVDGSGSSAMPKGNYLTTDPDSNRLVVAGTASSGGPGGAASSGSHVWFSEPGNPFAWTSTNYVILSPGDGEAIVGIVAWQGQLFVFKRSTLFVFYGEDTDVDGNPIFNYRSIALPTGSKPVTPYANSTNGVVAAGADAVYFVNQGGVWATTGDRPFRVSDSFIEGRTDPTPSAYSGLWTVAVGIHYFHEKLYITYDAGTGNKVMVLDLETGDIMRWTAAVGGFANLKATAGPDSLISPGTQGKYIYIWTSSVPSDDDGGTAISATWKSQWSDFDYYGEKRISNVEVWGSGACKLTVLSDFYDSSASQGKTTSTQTLTLGAADDNNFRKPAKAVFKESISGNYFSLKFESNSSNDDWQIDRVTIFYEPRDPRATRADSNN